MADENIDSGAPGASGARGTDLTTGSVARHLITFSIPMLMGSALQTAYSIVNALWVGNGLGTDAMAAITVSFPIFFVLMAVAFGLTLASNILVSQSYGAKDWVRLKHVVQNSLVLTAVVGLVCLVVGNLTAEFLLRLMRTPPEVLPMAVSYLRLFVFTIPFMFGVFFFASVMRGAGDSKTPLYFQAGSLALTAALDPLLMFGWLGLPRLGLNGTAVATIFSQALGLTALVVYLHRKQHIVAPEWRRLRVDAAMTWLTLKLGIPSMIQQALVSLGMLFIVGLVNQFGAHSSAAFGIAMRIDQLAFMPAMAIGAAASSLAGQNIGAKRYDRVREVFRWGITVSCGITVIATVLSFSVPAWLMHLFVQDPEVIGVGAHYLRIASMGYMMIAVMFVSNGVINGAGHTLATTFFTLIGFWLVRVPLAAYLSQRLSSVVGIWYAIVISFGIAMSVSLAYYFSGRWKHPFRRKSSALPLAPSVEVD